MFKANVGLSRGINSINYSVNIEGEINTPANDPQACLKQIKTLFQLAEDALAEKIDHRQCEQSVHPNGADGRSTEPPPQTRENSQPRAGKPQLASYKQVRFMRSLAERQGMSMAQLEDRIADVLHKRLAIQELTKWQAGRVIDSLNQTAPTD